MTAREAYIAEQKQLYDKGAVNYLIKLYLGDGYRIKNPSTGEMEDCQEPVDRDRAEKLILSALSRHKSDVLELLYTHPMIQTMPRLQIAATKLCKKICDDLRPAPPPDIKEGDHTYSNHQFFVSVLAAYGDPEAILALERCGLMSELWSATVSGHSRIMHEYELEKQRKRI